MTLNISVHREALLRYAKLQLRNDAWAEDAVSETLLAALEKPDAFEGRSQLKTWLIGILKYKILDKFRENAKEVALHVEDDDSQADALDDLMYVSDGHFTEAPREWNDPVTAHERTEFFVVLEACMSQMPAQLGRLFLMREWLELESDAICKELGITPTNFYVQLHRARLRLRECLDIQWFGK